MRKDAKAWSREVNWVACAGVGGDNPEFSTVAARRPAGGILACSNSPRATVDHGNALMLMENVGLLACTNSPRATVGHVDVLTSMP